MAAPSTKRRTPIGNRLRVIRTERGLSQKQLGIKAGIDQFVASARINQYETGKHVPDYGTIKKLAKVLDMPACYFYSENDDMADLLEGYHSLGKINKKKVIKYISNLEK